MASMFEPPRFRDGDNTPLHLKSSSSVVIVNLPPAASTSSIIATMASSFGPVAHVNRPEGYAFCFVHFKHDTPDTQGHADTFVPRALRARFIDVQVPVSGGANELGGDDFHDEDGARADTKNTHTEVCEHTTTTTTTVRCPIKPANHSDANIVRWRKNMAKKAISSNTL